jgi:two-component system cell cycle response regulator
MRILIADDSIVSRHVLDATLRKWGHDVVVACDGIEAWNVLQAQDAPKIAILDWVMPGLTGPEVCKRVREHTSEPEAYTYILLLTSKSLKEDLIEGIESGADDYVTKPFDQHELKVRLKTGMRIIDLQRQLREQATKDFLLHIWNRSSILDILQRELIRGGRENRSVGVVLADLDHFKSINDTYGHFAGDEVLKEFALRMQGSIRPYDAIGRYGGEEFLIILSNCDETCTANQAERLRKALDSEPMIVNGQLRSVTCSFGATSWFPGDETNSEMLIRVADDALYAAKHQGRNRVVYQREAVANVLRSK